MEMKKMIEWGVLGILLCAVFAMTLMRTPAEISTMLTDITAQLKTYALIVHGLFLAMIAGGLAFKKIRNRLFFLFIAFLSLSATIVSIVYAILPNILIFAMFFILIVNAYRRKELNFDLENARPVTLFFGTLGLIFGFWYLHWVADPLLLNALLYSPVGVINCPTMLTVIAFLILTVKPRSTILEFAVGSVTLYFGFFGLFRLDAYVDIALIACALFLLMRIGASIPRGAFFSGQAPAEQETNIRRQKQKREF